MTQSITRRNFLGSVTAAAAAGLAVPGIAMAAKAPANWDKTVDFLIIGTGFAGLGAAIEAHEIGIKNVLVVDKMPSAGGNSIINGGAVAAAGTDMQAKKASRTAPICSTPIFSRPAAV